MAAAVAGGSLRFSVSDRVECWWQPEGNQPGQWLLGVVIQLWWRQPDWPEGRSMPYQVRLEDGSLIYAPRDSDGCIREAAPQLEGNGSPAGALPYLPAYVPPVPAAVQEEVSWRKATAPGGKDYWYHPVTKESRWDEPVEGEVAGGSHSHSHSFSGAFSASDSAADSTANSATRAEPAATNGGAPLPEEVRKQLVESGA